MTRNIWIFAMACAGVTGALAQTAASGSVTLYGIADMAAVRTGNVNGSGVTGLNSGSLQASRIGFRGNEDLGGGLSAMFTLESGVGMDRGANTSAVFFNRQSWVGLRSAAAGTLTLGRQYTPVFDNLVMLSSAATFGLAGGAVDGIAAPVPGVSVGRFDNTLGASRVDNALKYTSPKMSGFHVNALWGMGEVAGAASAGRTLSVAGAYNQGPVSASIGYIERRCAAIACAAGQADNTVAVVGGGYNFGVAKLALIYNTEKNGRNVRGTNADVLSVNLQVPLGAWNFAAGYQQLNDKSAVNWDVRQFNLAAQFALSKRTALYGFYVNQKVDNGGKASVALFNASDSQQSQLGVGVRHAF